LADASGPRQPILVTGSGGLDFYGVGGAALQVRYHLLRLHPCSAAELGMKNRKELDDLLSLSGFPEPFLSGFVEEARRWSREYRTRLVREEVSSLERVTDLGNLELLMLSLPDRVGSPLTLTSLREDLQVSHKTVTNWMNVLERLYAILRIRPFGS